MEKMLVTMKTGRRLMRRISPLGMAQLQIAIINNMLKAALPTDAPGPSSPSLNLLPAISMQVNKIYLIVLLLVIY